MEKTIEDKRETNNNNVIEEPVVSQPIGAEQPEATSTPKMSGERRAIVPLPVDRDITDRGRESSYSDSLESDLEGRAISERMSGSDSGLEHSADELEVGGRRSSGEREVEVAEDSVEGVSGEASDSHEDIALDDIEPDTIPYLNTADSDSENDEDDISDSVTEPATDISPVDLLSEDEKEDILESVKDHSNFANFSDMLADDLESENEKIDDDDIDQVLRKPGELDTKSAITNMLSELSVDNESSRSVAMR